MSTYYTNPTCQAFVSVSRDINLVLLKGGDVLSIVNEVMPVDEAAWGDLQAGMQMYSSQGDGGNGSGLQWSAFYGTQRAQVSERCLQYYRVSNGSVVQGPRPVFFVVTSAKGSPLESSTKLALLREIYNPKITYDADANVLHLWFWSNALSWSRYYENMASAQFNMATMSSPNSKALFYATGKMVQAWCTGAYQFGYSSIQPSGSDMIANNGVSTQGFANSGWDMVPIFNNPEIIATTTTGSAGTQMGDGYAPQNYVSPKVFPVMVTSRVSNTPFHNVSAYPNGLGGYAANLIGEPLVCGWYDGVVNSWTMGIQTSMLILGDGY